MRGVDNHKRCYDVPASFERLSRWWEEFAACIIINYLMDWFGYHITSSNITVFYLLSAPNSTNVNVDKKSI